MQYYAVTKDGTIITGLNLDEVCLLQPSKFGIMHEGITTTMILAPQIIRLLTSEVYHIITVEPSTININLIADDSEGNHYIIQEIRNINGQPTATKWHCL